MSEVVFVCAHGVGGHKDDRGMLALAQTLAGNMHWLEGADHSLKGATALEAIGKETQRWLATL